jgi:hypothetical protein
MPLPTVSRPHPEAVLLHCGEIKMRCGYYASIRQVVHRCTILSSICWGDDAPRTTASPGWRALWCRSRRWAASTMRVLCTSWYIRISGFWLTIISFTH